MTRLAKRTKYPLSVDCVIFGYSEETVHVALIERKNPPFKGSWAIPGGFLIGNETVEEAAARELQEETGLHDVYLEQFSVFSAINRDPRGRVVSIGFFALIASDKITLTATEDARDAQWWPIDALPPLAFDHEIILHKAQEALRNLARTKPLLFELLPRDFTLTQLQKIYEEIFGISLDKRNFRKKIQKISWIETTNKTTESSRHRPAMLYRFNKIIYQKEQQNIVGLL